MTPIAISSRRRFRHRLRLLQTAAFAVTALVVEYPRPAPAADAPPRLDGWSSIAVPHAEGWEAEIGDHDGFAWFRAWVTVPAEWEGSRLLLIAGRIDNVDEAFVNGEKIGANGAMPPLFANPASDIRRPFVIEPDQVRFGEPNLIAWRVYDHDGRGGILEGPVHLTRRNDAIDLAGTWLFRTGDNPAWAGAVLDDLDAEAAAFREVAGAEAPGRAGIVPADVAFREAMIAEVYRRFEGNPNPYAKSDDKGDPLPPAEALARLDTPDDLAIDLVLAEPVIRQPLYVEFDARGRLWLTQYIQYPDPAGLEVLTWDQHLRKVFDRVPPPPPFDTPAKAPFRGRDVVSIHEDTDGDGRFDDHKVFADGLNLVTSTAQGRGGVWVMQPPYLLFYPDADADDVPDGDPVVHLSGFGLEDTHSIANSIKFGPDGWLYGATGSTVTARVRAHLSGSDEPLAFFGQNIWRYHPDGHRFELFAEGGWNTFGVDFDAKGRLYSGTNGTQQAVYFVQGGYYQKSFGKHGPHTNPHTFGHFFGLPIEGEKIRLVHQWLLCQGGAIPSLEGLLVGPNALASKLHALSIEPEGSRFRTVETANPIVSRDPWFRPVHVAAGPDGAIYVSDFYDARITHVDPRDNWDRDRGRVYRLRARDAEPKGAVDLAALTSAELVARLGDRNRWIRETARRLLSERADRSVVATLEDQLNQAEDGQLALESLWALHGLGAFDTANALTALGHADPHVRLWSVRLLGDPAGAVAGAAFERLLALAADDDHPEVVSQLAATAQRLPPAQSAPIVGALAARDAFADDPFIPLQLWWALEVLVTRDRERALALFHDSTFWPRPLVAGVLAENTARRLMAERSPKALAACIRLLDAAPTAEAAAHVVTGMEKALEGALLDPVPPSLAAGLESLRGRFDLDDLVTRFARRLGSEDALAAARAIASSPGPAAARLEAITTLAELRDESAEALFLDLVRDPEEEVTVRRAALNALRRYSGDAIPATVLDLHPSLPEELRPTATALLAGRPSWALRLLEAVDTGRLPRESIAFDTLLLVREHGDDAIDDLVRKHWGTLRRSSEEKAARMAAVRALLERRGNEGSADRGKTVFTTACAVCHKFGDLGRAIAPDLTGYELGNTEFLLTSIVDPNLGVREEFELATLILRGDAGGGDAATLVGFVVDAGERTLTLRDLAGNTTVLARSEIASESRAPVSVMPEGLLDGLTDQQILDLFAFLQGDAGRP